MSKSKFFVEQVKRGVTEGGMACGPVSGDVIVTIKYRKNDEPSRWLSNMQSMGFSTFYVDDFDPFDLLMSGDVENPKFGAGRIDEFEGVEIGFYEEMYETFDENKDNPAVLLLRYLIAVAQSSQEEIDDLIKLVEGHYIDEINVPISEDEEDFWRNKGFLIECAKCKIANGGVVCGPESSIVVATVKYRFGFETKWLTNIEVGGIPNFYLSDCDIFNEYDDEEVLENCFINKFEEISVSDYSEIDSALNAERLYLGADLIYFLVLITRSGEEKTQELIEAAEGEYLDDVDFLGEVFY